MGHRDVASYNAYRINKYLEKRVRERTALGDFRSWGDKPFQQAQVQEQGDANNKRRRD